MKLLISVIAFCSLLQPPGWLTNFETAQKISSEKHHCILLNFSGSDWCSPCIRMRKNIFESTVFSRYADTNLVLVNADFPRKKQEPALVKSNEQLADKFNKEGKFPYTLLINENGKVLHEWDGEPAETASQFVDELKRLSNAH